MLSILLFDHVWCLPFYSGGQDEVIYKHRYPSQIRKRETDHEIECCLLFKIGFSDNKNNFDGTTDRLDCGIIEKNSVSILGDFQI